MFSFGILPLLLKSGLFYTNSSWQSNDIIGDYCGHVRSIGERFVIIGHLCLSARGCCRALTMMVTHKVHSLNHCWMTTTTVTIEKTFVYVECSPSGADVNRWIPASERFSCRSTPATRSTSLASRSVLFNARHWLWITYLRDIVTNVISFNSNRRRDRIGDSYRFQMPKCMCGDRLRGCFQSSVFRRRCNRVREKMQKDERHPLDLHRPVCWSKRDWRFSSPFRSLDAAWTWNTETTRDTLYSASALRYLVARNAAILLHIHCAILPGPPIPGPLPLHVTIATYASSEGKKRSFSQ